MTLMLLKVNSISENKIEKFVVYSSGLKIGNFSRVLFVCCRFFASRFCFADDFTRRHLIFHKRSPSLFRPVSIKFFLAKKINKQTRAQVELKKAGPSPPPPTDERVVWLTGQRRHQIQFTFTSVSLSFNNFPNGFIIIRLGQNKKNK